MPNADLPIMIVDDAKFSGAVIGRTLKAAGFKDIRTASSAQQGLAMLESRPVNVLIADWLMPEMDGLELAGRVRQLDEATNHFTYIMLLTAKEGDQALRQAFDQGVDDVGVARRHGHACRRSDGHRRKPHPLQRDP